MKFQKSLILSFFMMTLFSFAAIANTPIESETASIKKQFADHLVDLNLDTEDNETIYIDFMVNDKSEVLVLSTTSKKHDRALKSGLNYKTIELGKLDYFKKYTIPVTFKK